ncbi:MAG: tetratricopeptide repeat protein [Treponema sp.]|nr:tetratricopeptide repeat protein [Treponema sp.]
MDIKKKHIVFKSFTVFLTISLITVSCNLIPGRDASLVDPYYITGSREDREKLKELFNLLSLEEYGSEGEFAVIREIAASFAKIGDYERLINFLSARTINNPFDPYNSYYYLMIAYAFIQLDSEPIAALYFDMILKNYPDLAINDESIHLVCLRHLINLNDKIERQVWYYNELITRFPDKIDLGTTYFMLGQACEQAGDWNNAVQAYANYLPYAGAIITGFPNAEQYARQKVDFSKSPKDWTFESLPALRAAVENAIDENNPWTLMQYQAKVNFFARSWEQMEVENIRMTAFNLAQFMYGNRIRYASTLDASSNATEAFLRTTGWSLSLNTWYLYFRKIYFPQDPEIHGRWEWAGIYYGEKF